MYELMPSFLTYFSEMLIIYIFFSRVEESKLAKWKCILIGTAIFSVGAVFNIIFKNSVWINLFSFFIINVAFSLICFNLNFKKILFYSALLAALMALTEIITIFFISNVLNIKPNSYNDDIYILIIDVLTSKSVYFLILLMLSRGKNSKTSKIPLSFYLFPISVTLTIGIFWYTATTNELNKTFEILFLSASVILFLSTILMFFSYQNNAEKEQRLYLLSQESEKLNTDLKYFNILENQNNNLRAYAHDAKNHLSAIKNLNTNPEIEMHISKMSESLAEYSKVCHSGNHTLDVIIDKYVTECKINGLNFEFDIKNNNLSKIEPYDTVTILGNLLDNALEAAKESAQKAVTFETDYRNDFSVIIISNSCDSNPMSDGRELPVTTKSNKRLHGFGLKSVKNTVKKYNGDIAFDYDVITRVFVVTIMI